VLSQQDDTGGCKPFIQGNQGVDVEYELGLARHDRLGELGALADRVRRFDPVATWVNNDVTGVIPSAVHPMPTQTLRRAIMGMLQVFGPKFVGMRRGEMRALHIFLFKSCPSSSSTGISSCPQIVSFHITS